MVKLCIPDMTEEEFRLVKQVLESGWLAHGDFNKQFEKEFAKYIGVSQAVTLNSCTSALQLALQASNIKGEVILPSFTFVASANSIVTSKAKPVFVDVDYDTCNIDSEKIEQAITKNTQAIMPVHFGGQSCNMKRIMEIAEKHNLIVIEDSAETIGGLFNNKKTGSFGIGCFSFYPTKNITTSEGGMVTTNNEKIANRIKLLSAHGISSHTLEREKQKYNWYRDASEAGYNFRMPNILAAIGVAQLKRIEEMNEKRRKIASYYNKAFSKLDNIDLPVEAPECKHVYQMYTIKLKDANGKKRDLFVQHLRENDIQASVHFSPPVHLQTYYKKNFKPINLPVTEKLAETIVTLPIYPSMEKNDIEKVTESVMGSSKSILR